jgi:hypothetical protein
MKVDEANSKVKLEFVKYACVMLTIGVFGFVVCFSVVNIRDGMAGKVSELGKKMELNFFQYAPIAAIGFVLSSALVAVGGLFGKDFYNLLANWKRSRGL